MSESKPERVRSFVDAISDVPGVSPRVRGHGEGSFVRVDVEFEYGNRDEMGRGDVSVAPGSDPVGSEAYEHDLRITRVLPLPERGGVALWFATAEDYDAIQGAEA